jgi:hypothetical protein
VRAVVDAVGGRAECDSEKRARMQWEGVQSVTVRRGHAWRGVACRGVGHRTVDRDTQCLACQVKSSQVKSWDGTAVDRDTQCLACATHHPHTMHTPSTHHAHARVRRAHARSGGGGCVRCASRAGLALAVGDLDALLEAAAVCIRQGVHAHLDVVVALNTRGSTRVNTRVSTRASTRVSTRVSTRA